MDKTSAYTQLAQEKTCASDSTKCLKDDDSTKITGFLEYDAAAPKDLSKATLIYKANVEGILVGDVKSLDTDTTNTQKRKYEVRLSENSAFIGSLDISDVPISIDLSSGSKVIFTSTSEVQTLRSEANSIDASLLAQATLFQKNNTIIDLATSGNAHNLVKKDTYSNLSVNHLNGVKNTIFRFSFGLNDALENASDRLIVKNVSNSKDNILQVYQNLSHPTTLKGDEKVLLASIANGSSTSNGKIFKVGEIFNNEGFDVIKSNIIVLDQNSSDPNKASAGTTYSNYYLASMSSSVNQDAANSAKAALNSNRSIILGSINDINKRMGELRDNDSVQGAWARVFNGMNSSSYGIGIRNIFTNIQAGYDHTLRNLEGGNEYVGVALSYGYNSLSSDGNVLKGNANMIELGAYYSYVADSGLYSDSILKYAFIANKLSTSSAASSMDYNTNAITFGQEIGYRFFLDPNKRFYVDPLAEINLGYFSEGNISQRNGDAFINTKIDANLMYRVKLGGNMGYRLISSKNQTDFRIGLSYTLDGSTANITSHTNLSSQSDGIPLSNGGVLQLGVNSIISDNWRAYMDVDVGFGQSTYRQDYLISLGGRYLFGKKPKGRTPSAYQINPAPISPASNSNANTSNTKN
ncbi:autotransporter outer membrane beta-barrel domain-containing protein, partial [Helicobacter sp. 13S00482-2]|uniref:autotransporter outer membrane beta-barrel domain-containing protein n=1 Tax=Helicobacter sp. 13S00482-2 TaxID=1476200 RepID=UPI0015DAC2B8